MTYEDTNTTTRRNSIVHLGKCWSLVFLGLVLISPVQGHEFELEILVGGDTNPNKLSETFEVETAPYSTTRMTLSHMPTRTGFYYDLDIQGDIYFSDEDAVSDPKNADRTRGEVTLGYKWRPRFTYGRARFKWDVYAGAKDSTYIRKSTGNVAVTGTPPVEIGDRFDASWTGFSTSGKVPISEEADFLYDLYVEDTQYEELTATNLSNLNYQQGEIDFGFEKRIWPKVNLKTMMGAGFRTYEDRRAKQENTGLDLVGTDLEYTFLEIENTLEYLITDRWKWQVGFDIDQRQDNEENYYDTTQGEFFMSFRYRNKKAVRFLVSASYLKREFDNIEENPVLGIDEEDLREREGFRVRFELNRNILPGTPYEMDVVIGGKVSSFENSNPIFTYDRSQLYFGIRWRPF